jgi:crotonobetainyl-CoA:carnitine CoA-transferase CaiB-like acyl-CoA transferase
METNINPPSSGPLAGIRVLDLSRVLSGPWAAQTLGDLGADVIKVEEPKKGDLFRTSPPHIKDRDGKPAPRESSLYLATNRNKKSITVNIASDAGRDLIRQLAAKSDVLLENFRPGTLPKRGLGYEDLSRENPGLIYCSVSGFGQTGPYALKGGYDSTFQAISGMMSYTGQPDGSPGEGPIRTGPSLCDISAGMYATVAIVTSLYNRTKTGRGQYIDIGMLDTTLAMISHQAMGMLAAGQDAPRSGNESPFGAPSGVFPCRDKPVMLNATQDASFQSLCEVLGIPEVGKDERFVRYGARVKNRAALNPLIAERTRELDAATLIAKLESKNLAGAPVNTTLQAYDDPHVKHRRMLREVPHPIAGSLKMVASPLNLSATPLTRYEAPPLLGQHTEQVLGELLGLSREQVAKLAESGAI